MHSTLPEIHGEEKDGEAEISRGTEGRDLARQWRPGEEDPQEEGHQGQEGL